MKLGLDFHGVIDKGPELFSVMSDLLVKNDHEVHIITGETITNEFKLKIQNFNIIYTHLFSIIDYHKSIGTLIRYEDNGPWIDEDLWNKTKAEYCERMKIDLHIDDSKVYGKYFTGKTKYHLFELK